MVTTAELAARDDFTLGNVVVSPPTRVIRGPGGSVDVEPRVMQVLVVLADAAGQVVTREALFNRCWGSVYVGDDSLNRAVAAVRRALADVGAERVEIETVPRTGYRLNSDQKPGETITRRSWTRRELAGAAAGAVALAGLGAWGAMNSLEDRRFEVLMREARRTTRDNSELNPDQAHKVLEQAVTIRPDDPRAWGLLAAVRTFLAQEASPDKAVAAITGAQDAAQRALQLDPKEPYGLLAMFELEGSTLDSWTRDRRLREIISIDPTNVWAIGELTLLLQASGYSRESWNWNARAIALEPLSEDLLTKRSLKLWIFGRVAQSDKVIDQLRALFPTSPWCWWVRMMLYALTDRPRAAQAMIDAEPSMLGNPEGGLWRAGITALISPTRANIAKARAIAAAGARTSGDLAGQGVMILAKLGDVDGAFEIANGYLLSRGSIVRSGNEQSAANDATGRINTQWLFTPACSAMFADRRFLPLCEGIGLTEYWRRRGIKPDYMRSWR